MGYNRKFSYLELGEDIDNENHVIVSFELESNIPLDQAAEAIAIESSIGTWTDIPTITQEIFDNYAAKIIDIRQSNEKIGTIKIAYPLKLFETDNLPQFLSIVAGNSLSLTSVENIKIMDVEFPSSYLKVNKGPAFGITGLRDKLRIYDRPLISTVIKPKVGISFQGFTKLAYEAWVGGVDIVRDDENLTDQDISPFYERVNIVMQALREAERVTGEKKLYIPNVTARLSEMYARAKFVQEMGGSGIMIDIASVGMSGVQFMRDQNLDLLIHGHRISGGNHSSVSLMVFAKLARLAGIDIVHIPTAVGKMKRIKENTLGVNEFLRSDWDIVDKVMPIASGGLHPGHIEKIIAILGEDQIINMSGGILAHPMGAEAGARAVKTAVEGVMKGQKLREISTTSVELKAALDKWGVFGEDSFKHENPNTNIYALVKSKGLDIEEKDDSLLTPVKSIESRDDL